MATLAEFYIVSTGIGFCYALWGFMAGHIGAHGGDAGTHAHHGISDHGFGHSGGGHGAHHGGHDGGGGDTPDMSGGGDAPDMSASGSHGGSHGHGHGDGGHGDGDAPDMEAGARTSAQAVRSSAGISSRTNRGFNIVGFLLKILSPMTIAMFLFYFGMTGVFVTRILKLPDFWALLPALILGYIGMKLTQGAMSWVISRMRTSSNFSETQIIGQIAQVSVSIPADKMGEIVFLVGKGRQNAPARCAKTGVPLTKDSEVVITDVRDGVFYVEGWNDDTLDGPIQVIQAPEKKPQESGP